MPGFTKFNVLLITVIQVNDVIPDILTSPLRVGGTNAGTNAISTSGLKYNTGNTEANILFDGEKSFYVSRRTIENPDEIPLWNGPAPGLKMQSDFISGIDSYRSSHIILPSHTTTGRMEEQSSSSTSKPDYSIHVSPTPSIPNVLYEAGDDWYSHEPVTTPESRPDVTGKRELQKVKTSLYPQQSLLLYPSSTEPVTSGRKVQFQPRKVPVTTKESITARTADSSLAATSGQAAAHTTSSPTETMQLRLELRATIEKDDNLAVRSKPSPQQHSSEVSPEAGTAHNQGIIQLPGLTSSDANVELLYPLDQLPEEKGWGAFLISRCFSLSADLCSFIRRTSHGWNSEALWTKYTNPVQSPKADSDALFLFLHGLDDHPRTWEEYLVTLNKTGKYDLWAPIISERGNIDLDSALSDIAEPLKTYMNTWPNRPVVIVGTSNGARLGLILETQLRSIKSKLMLASIAGVHGGTTMIDYRPFNANPSLYHEISFLSQHCRDTISAARRPLNSGTKRHFVFYAAADEIQVSPRNSALPVLDQNELFFFVRHTGHISVVEKIRDDLLARAIIWIDMSEKAAQ